MTDASSKSLAEHDCTQHVRTHNGREAVTKPRGRRRKGMKYTWATKFTCGVCGRKLDPDRLFANPRSVLCQSPTAPST